MPYLKIETNRVIGDIEAEDLKHALEKVIMDVMGKPLERIMVAFDQIDMDFGGSNEACAYAQLQSLGGLSKEVNDELCVKFCAAITNNIHVPADRIFINFIHLERDHWGNNEGTFA